MRPMLDVHEMEVNFGPQHPSTHGVLRVILKIDGERILDAKPIIGYLHRGTEKLFEHMAYPQCIPHTDRMDYVASATNNLDRKSTRLNSSHGYISYAVFCLKKKKKETKTARHT